MKKPLIIFLILLSLRGFAQESPIEPAPLLVDKLSNNIIYANYTTSVVPKKSIQFDLDFVYEWHKWEKKWGLSHPPAIDVMSSLPELKIRYGILKNLELRIGTRLGYNRFQFNFRDGGPIVESLWRREFREVFSDYLVFGGKVNLMNYNNKKGKLAALAESYIPAFRSKLTDNNGLPFKITEVIGPHFSPTFTIINSNQFSSWFGYNLNAGAHFNFSSGDTTSIFQRPFINFYQINLTPTFQITKKVNFYTGTSTIIERYKGENDTRFYFHAGLLFQPLAPLQFRLSGFYGKQNSTYNSSQKTNINLGIAWRPNL